jgi:GAF domain-containing protein
VSTSDRNAIAGVARLDALLQLGLLDAPPQEAFDRLTRLAARLTGAPFAAISLIDDHRQYVLAMYDGTAGPAQTSAAHRSVTLFATSSSHRARTSSSPIRLPTRAWRPSVRPGRLTQARRESYLSGS